MNKNTRILSGRFVRILALVLAVAMVPAQALAIDVYLKAQQFDKDIRDGSGDGSGVASIPMWGYAECDATFSDCDELPGDGTVGAGCCIG